MQQALLTFLKSSYSEAEAAISGVGKFISRASSPLRNSQNYKWCGELWGKGKQFYQDHKEIVIVVSTVTITYFLLRKGGKVEQDKKKKKKVFAKKQNQSKSFISQDDEPFGDQPSTQTNMREEFSDSEVRKGKGQAKKSNNILEIINSSEEEEEDDKIFFEMYKYYQAS